MSELQEHQPRVRPLRPGDSPEDDINGILSWTEADWWRDSRMFGVIAHIPATLRAWVAIIASVATVVDPVTWELMALRGAFVTGCRY